MYVSYEATGLQGYVARELQHQLRVQGTVISIYVLNENKRRRHEATTELTERERSLLDKGKDWHQWPDSGPPNDLGGGLGTEGLAAGGVGVEALGTEGQPGDQMRGERMLWFRIIQDGRICASVEELRRLQSCPYELVTRQGLLNVFSSEFVETVGSLVCTTVSEEAVTFLSFFYGHLRSSIQLHTALSHSTKADPCAVAKAIKVQWHGECDSRKRPSNPELWVDSNSDINCGGLPLLFLGSSANRLMPLIVRDLWGNACRNTRAMLWESLYVNHLLGVHSANGSNGGDIHVAGAVLSAGACSPFSVWFNEMISASSTTIALKHAERHVFDINKSMRTVRVEARQTGGRVDSHLFMLLFGGKRLSRKIVITPLIDSLPNRTLLGRLCPQFDQPWDHCNSTCHQSTGQRQELCGGAMHADFVSISTGTTRIATCSIGSDRTSGDTTCTTGSGGTCGDEEFDENMLVKSLKESWFNSIDTHNIILLPLSLTNTLSVLLLLQLVWLSVPMLRERAQIIIVNPNSTLLNNTIRLLIDALSYEIRDLFVCTKNYLVSNLLDGFQNRKKDNIYTKYVDNINLLPDVLAKGAPLKLIVSSPESIEEGWTKDIYYRYIHRNPAAKLLVSSPHNNGVMTTAPNAKPNDQYNDTPPPDAMCDGINHHQSHDQSDDPLNDQPNNRGNRQAQSTKMLLKTIYNIARNADDARNDADILRQAAQIDAYFTALLENEFYKEINDAMMQEQEAASSEYNPNCRPTNMSLKDDVNSIFENLKDIRKAVKQTINVKMPTAWDDLVVANRLIPFDRAFGSYKLEENTDSHYSCAIERVFKRIPTGIQFTKSLFRTANLHIEGSHEAPVSTGLLPLIQIPVAVCGLEMLKAKMTDVPWPPGSPGRCVLSNHEIQRVPVEHKQRVILDSSSAPASSSNWLLGILKGLGEAMKGGEQQSRKVTRRAFDNAVLPSLHTALPVPSTDEAQGTMLVKDLPPVQKIVNSVYHEFVSTMSLKSADRPRLATTTHNSIKTVHVKSNNIGVVQLGVIASIVKGSSKIN
ncbi:hypothetical protein GNI_017200 [Gregarina niphandrodes]|uniref:Uncharacterized protein n=1 Tax=Gregarina niphandrodes TaxID=110365 RepID=A0A023BC42_GRENI|nr:hypothetical protein GNI_017200 [Gregarina niphandrodes]EZG82143.1 hypothetical protein GNI_017200 [Gregarina niphandrodes]|eukprot:XP_011129028.1 hypothetical protein GNI_017200 [Gregarina niphandrodes]